MPQTRTDIDPARRPAAGEPEHQDAVALRRYLLGELAPPEAAAIEDRLFESDELFELAEAIEAELLDAEARGGLTPAPESPLRRLGRSAWGRRRRDFSGALAVTDLPALLTARERFVIHARRAAPALALAASLVGVLVTVPHIWDPAGQGGNSTNPPPQLSTHERPQPTEISLPPRVIPLVLGGTRGAAEGAATPLAEATKEVEFHLDVTGENSARFDVVIRDSGSEREIRRFSGVSSVDDGHGGRELRLRLEAGQLPRGEIEIELREADGELLNHGWIRLQ